MKTLVIYITVFLGFLFAVKKYNSETKDEISNKTPDTDDSIPIPTDYDWSTTTIGKFLHPYLGNDTNWIIWTVIVLVVLWIITTILTTYFADELKKVKGIKIGFFGFLLILVLGYAGYLAIDWKKITIFKKEPEAKVEKSSFVNANRFSRAHNGEVSIVTMSVAQTVRVKIHTTSPRIHGTGKVFWACAEVTKPSAYSESVNFEIDPKTKNTPVNNIRLTKESRDMLIKDGIMEMEVTFTQTLGTPNQSPCKH